MFKINRATTNSIKVFFSFFKKSFPFYFLEERSQTQQGDKLKIKQSYFGPNPNPYCRLIQESENLFYVTFHETGMGQLCMSLTLSFMKETLPTRITSDWN